MSSRKKTSDTHKEGREMLRTLLACVLVLLGAGSASAAEALVRHGGSIDRFVLQNTTNPAFEGYIILVLAGAEHKVVYQTGPANDETFTAFCNTNDHDDPCDTFNPDPVYAEWDAAAPIEDGDLTPANRRKWIWAWTYQEHIKKAVAVVETYLTTLSGLSGNAARRVYSGALQSWGISPTQATTCATMAISMSTVSTGDICTHSETGLVHITGRIKRLVEDLDSTVLDLP